MHLPQFAKRRVVALAALSVILAACNSTAPDKPFSAAGTSADVASVDAAFDSPALQSYGAAAEALSVLSGGMPPGAVGFMPPSALRSQFGAAQYAKRISARLAGSSTKPSFSIGNYAGKTFEYDPEEGIYVETDRTGAPANGVRLILYAVDPVTHDIVTSPLTEVGYAQLTVTGGGTATSVRLTVVSGGTTYLDYTAAQTITSTSLKTTIVGFVTNGTDRAEFNVSLQMTGDEENGSLTIKHTIKVPTQGFRIGGEVTFTTEDNKIAMKFEARGNNGRVTVEGAVFNNEGTGSFTVKVNGELFAVMTQTSMTVTLTDPDGGELTDEERDALEDVFEMFGKFQFFDDFLVPVGLGIG